MSKIKFQICLGCIMLIIGLYLFSLCSRPAGTGEQILAVIDNRYISDGDFIKRVELSPLPPYVDIKTYKGREDALNLLIAEKLLAVEAESKGLQHNPLFLHKIENVKKSAVVRELYREVVRKEVTVDEHDVREAFEKMNEKLVVRFIQSNDLNRIRLWSRLLDKGMPFDTLLERIQGRPLTENDQRIEFTWGQAEPAIEDAAYNLEKGGISSVLKVSNGYIILKLENRIKDVMLTEEKYASKKRTIEKIIRRRREAVRSGEFVENFMKDKNVVLKGLPFNYMVKELEKQIDFNRKKKKSSRMKMLVQQEVNLVEDNLTNHLDDVLVEFEGRGWTVGQFLEKLWMMEVPLNRESPVLFEKNLKESIKILVRDELLAEEGLRRGLAKTHHVRKEVSIWKDNFLYAMMKNRYIESGMDIQKVIKDLRRKYSVKVDSTLLKKIELTNVPMVAVWTDLQRQLVVPIWPQLSRGD